MDLRLPLWDELDAAQRILLAGCGGGFDVYHALPLYFALKAKGKEVFLGSLAFTDVERIGNAKRHKASDSVQYVEVTAASTITGSYFPEGYMAQWFKERHDLDVPVYTFRRTGCKPLLEAYRHLVDLLNIDTIVLVDGGSDSLMTGHEAQLGSIEEDWSSMAAVHALDIPRKILCILGLGVDRFHGVSDVSSLRAIAELTAASGYLGCFSLLPNMQPVKEYTDLLEYALRRDLDTPSIVGCCIRDAIQGHFGDYHSNPRTAGSKLFINPLMCQLHCMTVAACVARWKEGVLEQVVEMSTTYEMRRMHHQLGDQAARTPLEEFPKTIRM